MPVRSSIWRFLLREIQRLRARICRDARVDQVVVDRLERMTEQVQHRTETLRNVVEDNRPPPPTKKE